MGSLFCLMFADSTVLNNSFVVQFCGQWVGGHTNGYFLWMSDLLGACV